jgi:FkbM family methyltransferase
MGVYTRAALAAGASRVIAIEPAPENLECLRRTFAREIASGRVTLVEKGVWHQDHVLEMFQQPDNNAADSFVVDWTGRGRKVRLPLTTIDRIVEELNLPRVDYIKMDIEGAERNALDGGVRTLRRFHPAMALCVYHLKDDPVVIPQRVRAAWPGYRQRCGPCLDTNRRFRPQVYFFY